MDSPDQELSILLTDDREIRQLNRDYRGRDSATDVLSFSQREGDAVGAGGVLGDVVISLETAAAQAKEYGCPVEEELSRLLIHGILHLLGYDHEKGEAEAVRMADLERRYLFEPID